MNFLSKEEQEELKAKHKLERDRRVCDRIKAILLSNDGWSDEEIAKVLLLSKSGIRTQVAEYKNSQKLKPGGGGSAEKLTLKQSKELENHLEKYTYLYVKDMLLYVHSKWKVRYTTSGMTDWLERHGFSYKKPSLVPGKADREKQAQWIEDYQNLKDHLTEDETICFMDGVHPTHNVQPGYGWIKKGMRKEVPSNSGRLRLNLTGIIDIKTHRVFVRQEPTLNAEQVIDFFKQIETVYPTKKQVHIFCDNASYYKNRRVSEHLKGSKVQLHFLPPYSPNLNPIERLWKWMKERVIYNTYYEDFCSFKSAIFGFFRTISGLDPGSALGKYFRSRIKDKFRPVSTRV